MKQLSERRLPNHLERMLTSRTGEHSTSAGAAYMQQCATEYVKSAARTISNVTQALARQLQQISTEPDARTRQPHSPATKRQLQDKLTSSLETLQHATLQLAAITLPAAVPLLSSGVLREVALSGDLIVAVATVLKFVCEFSLDLKSPAEQAFTDTSTAHRNFAALIHGCRATVLVLEAIAQGNEFSDPEILEGSHFSVFECLRRCSYARG